MTLFELICSCLLLHVAIFMIPLRSLVALVFLFGVLGQAQGAPRSDTETATLYINKHFEMRDHDAPTKYVWHGETRVAKVTCSLKDNIRVQRLRLWPGWNLCSIAVNATDARSQLVAGRESSAALTFKYDTNQQHFLEVQPSEPMLAGTVLWLHSPSNLALRVIGNYPGLVAPTRAPPEGLFHPGTGLEMMELGQVIRTNASAWHYDGAEQRWHAQLANVSALYLCVSNLGPGEAFFTRGDPARELSTPNTALSIRYYHQDHLGSSSSLSDSAGIILEEFHNYPFGLARFEFRLTDIEEQFGFTQKEKDKETGLHYFSARYLAVGLAHFCSVDPLGSTDTSALLGIPQRQNPFAYCYNQPIIHFDPTGMEGRAVLEGLNRLGNCIERNAAAARQAALGASQFITGLVLAPTVETVIGGLVSAALMTRGIDNMATSLGLTGGGGETMLHQAVVGVTGDEKAGELFDMMADAGLAHAADNLRPRPPPNSGRAPKVHGNDHNTPQPAQGYTLRDRNTGKVLKYGETTQGTKRYSQKYLAKNNAEMVFEAQGTKREMHNWQHERILEHKETNNGDRPPLNKSDY
jgi:RHS repeat-associated protein